MIHVVSASRLPIKARFCLFLGPLIFYEYDAIPLAPQDAMSGLSDPFIVFMVQQVVPFSGVFKVSALLISTQKAAPAEPWKVSDKTPVQKKTLNPVWNYSMIFSIALDSAQAVAAPDKVHAIMCCTSTGFHCFLI